jgi:two-component system nitrate/nitrite response regulator NarL
MKQSDETNFEQFLRQFSFRAPAPPPIDTTAAGAKSTAVSFVIADDHEMFREGLRRLLEEQPRLEVIGEARDGAKAVELTRRFKPDLLLLDLSMPNHPGLEALMDLGSGGPSETRVILLTAEIAKRQIVEALQMGARGVVLKSSATEFLFEAIQTVMAGGYWVGRERVANLVQYLRNLMQSTGEESRRRRYGLTERELEIVSAVVEGCSNKEMAAQFKISPETVKHHLSNIFNKLGVSTRLELAMFAVNHSVPLRNIAQG